MEPETIQRGRRRGADGLGFALDPADIARPVRAILMRWALGGDGWVCYRVDEEPKIYRYSSLFFVLATLLQDWHRKGTLSSGCSDKQGQRFEIPSTHSEYGFLVKSFYYERPKQKQYRHGNLAIRQGRDSFFPVHWVGKPHEQHRLTCHVNPALVFCRVSDLPEECFRSDGNETLLRKDPKTTLDHSELVNICTALMGTEQWGKWRKESNRPRVPHPGAKGTGANDALRPGKSSQQAPANASDPPKTLVRIGPIRRHVKWIQNLVRQVPLPRPYKDSNRSLYVAPSLREFHSSSFGQMKAGLSLAPTEQSAEEDLQPPVLLDLINAGKRVFLLGEAGAGKSTLLDHMAWELAGEFLADRVDPQPRRVPFLVRLGELDLQIGSDLLTLVKSQSHDLSVDTVEQLCLDGQAAILLDGLDKVGDPQRRVELMRQLAAGMADPDLAKCPIVLSGWPGAFDWTILRQGDGECLVLADFDDCQISQYIKQYPFMDSTLAYPLIPLVFVSYLRAHAGWPPLLSIICWFYEQGYSIFPANEGDFLERALPLLLHLQDPDATKSLFALGKLAWYTVVCDEPSVLSERAFDIMRSTTNKKSNKVQNESISRPAVMSLDRRARENGILDCTTGHVQFTQESYRQYLAGRYLAMLAPDRIRDEFGKHVWDPRWWHVLYFMMTRLWADMQQRSLGTDLVQWLLAESATGHDDLWQTLLILAGWLSSSAGPARNEREEEVFEEIAYKVFPLLRSSYSTLLQGPAQSLIPDTSVGLLTLVGERLHAMAFHVRRAYIDNITKRKDSIALEMGLIEQLGRTPLRSSLEFYATVKAARSWLDMVPFWMHEDIARRYAVVSELRSKPGNAAFAEIRQGEKSLFWMTACDVFHRPDTISLLASLLDDDDDRIRHDALAALTKIGGPGVLAVLERFLCEYPLNEICQDIERTLSDEHIDNVTDPVSSEGMQSLTHEVVLGLALAFKGQSLRERFHWTLFRRGVVTRLDACRLHPELAPRS